MDVTVVGGGIGGLVLAQGLRRRGVGVQVLERDDDVAATGGYRLHLSPAACAVLERELVPTAWRALVAAASAPGTFRAMHVVDRRLRLLTAVPAEGGTHLLVGRVPLRRVLADGLGESLRLGQRVTGYAADGAGVVATCASGTEVAADLLVAADGVGSAVAQQAAGRPTAEPVGLVGLAGRTSRLEPHDAAAPTYLTRGPALAVGTGGVGLFVTRHEPGAESPEGLGEPPAWVWGLVLAQAVEDRSVPRVEDALERMEQWSPWARDLVTATHPDQLGSYRFHAGDPRTSFARWTEPRVTTLGDAVHAMPPTGGQSASTAIEDAGDLLRAIDEVRTGACSTDDALAAYRRRVVDRAGPRVRESLAPARWITRTRGPVGSAALTGVAAVARAGRTVGAWAGR